LKALQPFRNRVVVLSGLGTVPWPSDNSHSHACTTWLSGVPPKRTEGANVQSGKTIDQIVFTP